MSNQWLRYCRLVVQSEEGSDNAIDLSNFRVKFDISQAVTGKPCTATITVYNVSQDTVNSIPVPTFANVSTKKLKVLLAAGYQDNHGMIFSGDMWWKGTGRESVTDTYMRLIASSGDRVHQHSIVSKAFKSGTTQQAVIDSICNTFSDFGVEKSADANPVLNTSAYLRGKVVYDTAPSALDNAASTNNFAWGYDENGAIQMMNKDMMRSDDGEVLILASDSGLIGRPQVTPDGITARCLINPKIGLGTYVQLDTKALTYTDWDTSWNAVTNNRDASTTKQVDCTGLYRVVGRTIHGDTRGNDWYCDLVMLSVTAGTPVSPTAFNFLQN